MAMKPTTEPINTIMIGGQLLAGKSPAIDRVAQHPVVVLGNLREHLAEAARLFAGADHLHDRLRQQR